MAIGRFVVYIGPKVESNHFFGHKYLRLRQFSGEDKFATVLSLLVNW